MERRLKGFASVVKINGTLMRRNKDPPLLLNGHSDKSHLVPLFWPYHPKRYDLAAV